MNNEKEMIRNINVRSHVIDSINYLYKNLDEK